MLVLEITLGVFLGEMIYTVFQNIAKALIYRKEQRIKAEQMQSFQTMLKQKMADEGIEA